MSLKYKVLSLRQEAGGRGQEEIFELYFRRVKTAIEPNEFCFCTLALGYKYELMSQELAKYLQKYAAQNRLVVGSEHPENFKACYATFDS
jgi:hypothetical protein